MKIFLKLVVLCTLLAGSTVESHSQKKKKNEKADDVSLPTKGKIKPYNKVITGEANTDEGLFKTHQVGAEYFFEIPNDLLEKEILIVSRISGHVKGLNFGGAGMKSRPQQVIRFQRIGDRILLRSVSFNSVADEDQPIYTSVKNNNFEPVIMTFDVAAESPDKRGVVIKVNDLFTTDVSMIGALSADQRKNFKIKGLDKDRSFITEVKSFPENILVRHILTYRGDELPDNRLTGTLSLEMTQSMILLPENPWVPRLHDERVGFFSIQQIDYGLDEQKAATRRYITRWRLEPTDWEAYLRGELVAPVKPIVYYIDPATPKKWVPYIKQGVDDWQSAFEKAGFKNAIMGKVAPTPEEDPEWSPEDVRYSVIRYIATDIQNAQGPHVHDPRTGEILESDILWYHNVMNLLRNWFFVQTAALNPAARGTKFEDAIMGQLIRFVAAHEVGHTLGYPHNMGSSPAYPVDSLRSPTFTATHGTAPSIMDYARFNYIAQPGDGVTNFYPQIGEYDDWAVLYGYKLIDRDLKNPADEKKILNDWITERAGNPVYRYGRQRRAAVDPSAQTEDLGDDAMYASELGIANLKHIKEQLLDWSTEDGKNYEELQELYGNIIGQFNRYMRHVSANVGGVYEYYKTSDQEGMVYEPTQADKQQRAVAFMNMQLFQTPNWLIDNDLVRRFEETGTVERVMRMQGNYLNQLLDEVRIFRLIEQEAMNEQSYGPVRLFDDLTKGIWSELPAGRSIDAYRRNLQKLYVHRLHTLMDMKDAKFMNSDIPSIARANLKQIQSILTRDIGKQRGISRFHLEDVAERIDEILDAD